MFTFRYFLLNFFLIFYLYQPASVGIFVPACLCLLNFLILWFLKIWFIQPSVCFGYDSFLVWWIFLKFKIYSRSSFCLTFYSQQSLISWWPWRRPINWVWTERYFSIYIIYHSSCNCFCLRTADWFFIHWKVHSNFNYILSSRYFSVFPAIYQLLHLYFLQCRDFLHFISTLPFPNLGLILGLFLPGWAIFLSFW